MQAFFVCAPKKINAQKTFALRQQMHRMSPMRENNGLPVSIQDAIDAFSSLPGIGSRSAERLVFTLLRNHTGLDQRMATAIGSLKTNVTECSVCHNYCQVAPDKGKVVCNICNNHGRDARVMCVVETPVDLIALERTAQYKGMYHVLHGVVSPMSRVRPEDLRITELTARVMSSEPPEEIILALSGSTEGEATGLYIMDRLEGIFDGKITRLARGIPTGGDLDYLDMGTLARALMDRREF
jgi:recombination protein RecR